nr:MAG TPA: hypothetical protein [Crassvirales sp.]
MDFFQSLLINVAEVMHHIPTDVFLYISMIFLQIRYLQLNQHCLLLTIHHRIFLS